MKTFLAAATVAAAMLAGATTAGAAQFVTWSPVNPDGSFSGNFGDTGITTPTFTDVFDFTLPTGSSSFTVNSTFTDNPSNNINFTTVTYNGAAFSIISQGQNEFRALNGVSVAAGGPQHLVVSGTSGGSGSYDGVISFSRVTAVPEPAAWALMIMGFGGVGGIVRSRRRQVATAA
ncbi:MAG TPA: FxDxF family PEP-CTERM protein [Phenylobacterium sp.]|jgi:hypothetical protein|nr:FxDxF family PEP-CTERM protein [Phenylobacterium sp.]HXA37880.1 FxDxF family PEP-CTERM protein [Phenylobacterium sp.]